MTARSQGAGVLGENNFEDEELHKLLGPTPEPNQPLHPAVKQLRWHAITDPATIRDNIKTLAIALTKEAGCTNKITWKGYKDSARTCWCYQAHNLAGISMRVRATEKHTVKLV